MSEPQPRLEEWDLEGIDVTVCSGRRGRGWAGLDRGFAIALGRTLNERAPSSAATSRSGSSRSPSSR